MNTQHLDRLLQGYAPGRYFSGEEDYLHSVVLLLLMPVGEEYHLVFERRSPKIRQGGEICFPGGTLEPDDPDPAFAARRETSEELGIPIESVKVIAQADTHIAPLGVVVYAYIGTADAAFSDLRPNPDEVESVFSIPVSYFMEHPPQEYRVLMQAHPFCKDTATGERVDLLPSCALGLPERYREPWGSLKRRVFVYPTDQGLIWGITARLVYDFVSELKKAESKGKV